VAEAAPAAAAKAAVPVVAAAASTAAPEAAAPAAPAAPAAAPPTTSPALTGSAAILARLRSQQQRGGAAAAAPAGTADGPATTTTTGRLPRLVVAYASQTGTAQEIARNIAAEALARAAKLGAAAPYSPPPKGAAVSFNQLSWPRVGATETPILIVVASSTGDGEPPDNAAVAYVAMRKGGQELKARLKGVRATVLGLGDSNYTRYMAVPRAIRGRMTDLGAETFYPGCDADEVDGLEATVDSWIEGLWPALEAAGRAWIAENRGGGGGAAAEAAAAPAAKEQPAVVAEKAAGELGADKAALAAALPVAAEAAAPAVRTAAAPSPAPSATSTTTITALTASAKPSDSGTATVDEVPAGVPALAPARIRLVFEGLPEDVVAAARARDAAAARGARPDEAEDDAARAPSPTADAPAYVRVSGAKVMTSEWSDRRVVHVSLDVGGTPLDGSSNKGGGGKSGDNNDDDDDDDGASSSAYGPGDAVGVLPRNDPALVDGVLAALGQDGDAVFDVSPVADDDEGGAGAQGAATADALAPHLGAPCTLRSAFSRALDLTTPARKSLLRLLAEHASDPAERRHLLRLCGRDGRAAYSEEIVKGRPTLLDLLARFPSAARSVPLSALVDALPPLAPRLYSVASAPAEQPTRLDFAFSAVTVEQTLYPGPVADGAAAAEGGAAAGAGATRGGVATGWLQRLLLASSSSFSSEPSPPPSDVYLPVFLRRAIDFRPPDDLATPVIMIGPGTGVAPFRGFLQQRRAQAAEEEAGGGQAAAGPAWLYFGCRRRDEDCLFAEDWEAFVADGTLQKLRLAFSREPVVAAAEAEAAADGEKAAATTKKTYVQHLMAEDAEELGELIVKRGARVYVCGDGAQMAKDVHACLARIVGRASSAAGASSDADADATGTAELAAMAKAGRYVRDIWC
jgi:NADPH-ferrihemoprotein reductase